jgi:hypothetical protein
MADAPVSLSAIAAEIEKKPELRTGTRKTATDQSSDVHAEALLRYESGYEKDRKNQDLAYEDLRFRAEEGQWEARAKQEREQEGRPILTINKCPQFVRQVTGDIRQLRPAIKVVPVDDMASKDVATKILPGMLRYIEQRSDAKGAYFAAADQQVGAGIGHVRVNTEMASGTTMDQEICIGAVEDGISVIWDPDAIHPTRRDAEWCFVPIDMARKTFERKYPDASSDPLTESKEMFYTWFTDDHVRVTEYWCKTPIKRRLAIYPEGAIVDLTDDKDGAKQADVDAYNANVDQQMAASSMSGLGMNYQQAPSTLGAPMQAGPMQPPQQPQRVEIEERDSYQVERYVISARDILEGPEIWPGAHIPIAPALGEETKIGREIIRNGIIRALKDAQRLYNYSISADAEVVALQPKAPYKGTRKNFEKYQDQWETANSRNWPYLEYEPDDKNGGAAPAREPPPLSSSGIRELLLVASEDMSAVTGIYPAALGAKSNETSGRAITARQREGDTGTYVYIENFGRMVQRVGEIVVDLIPHIYDTKRTIRIVGEDGKIDMMEINKEVIDPNGDGIATVVMNDLTVGTYEVAVEMGPSYSTRREEARDGMQAFMQAAGPQVAQLYIDLFARMQDWPLSDKIAKRAQLLLPQPIQQLEAQESGEPLPPPMPQPPPSPEQQMEVTKLQGEQELNVKRLELDNRKIDAELARIDADLQVANRSHEAAMAGHACTIAQLKHGKGGAQENDKVDALADAVAQLNSIVSDMANALGLTGQGAPNGGGNPIPPPSPMGGPVSPSPGPNGPPPGAMPPSFGAPPLQ